VTAPPAFPLVTAPARAGDLRLAGWRANVGGSVAFEPSAASPAPGHLSLLVLSWNVWVGRGRLVELVGRLRDGAFTGLGADPALPLVILLQEAFRIDGA
jgi:hypothetical protein